MVGHRAESGPSMVVRSLFTSKEEQWFTAREVRQRERLKRSLLKTLVHGSRWSRPAVEAEREERGSWVTTVLKRRIAVFSKFCLTSATHRDPIPRSSLRVESETHRSGRDQKLQLHRRPQSDSHLLTTSSREKNEAAKVGIRIEYHLFKLFDYSKAWSLPPPHPSSQVLSVLLDRCGNPDILNHHKHVCVVRFLFNGSLSYYFYVISG
ncbi:Uncharacterized protein Fot_38207 [Forsythia ovata]|uniref:Ribosomal protein S14 n=1 Tax=Forsythia ovata TaxID=205694 RepID=A0ABD1S156_9LAMI